MTLLLNYALRWRERVCAAAIVRVCRISSVRAAQIGTDQNLVTHLTLTLTHTAAGDWQLNCLRSLASVFKHRESSLEICLLLRRTDLMY